MVTVVTGPPCSGKTTHISRHAKPGDVVIDYDLIAVALGSPDSHDHPDHIRFIARQARHAAIKAALNAARGGATVWIIDSQPGPGRLRSYHQAGAVIVCLTAAKEELHRRAKEAGRPTRWHAYIERHHDAGHATSVIRERGIREW